MPDERDAAINLANRILDTPAHDPDSMESVLSRQFLRALERIDTLAAALATARAETAQVKYCGHAVKCPICYPSEVKAETAEHLQHWLDAPMECGHPQRYRTGINGKTDAEWLQLECDECLICEREKS